MRSERAFPGFTVAGVFRGEGEGGLYVVEKKGDIVLLGVSILIPGLRGATSEGDVQLSGDPEIEQETGD